MSAFRVRLFSSQTGLMYSKCFLDGYMNPTVAWDVISLDVNHKNLQRWRNQFLASQGWYVAMYSSCRCRVWVCNQVMYTQWPTHCICRCLYYWLSQAVSRAFYVDLRALLISLHPHPLLIKQYLLIPRLIKDFWNQTLALQREKQ